MKERRSSVKDHRDWVEIPLAITPAWIPRLGRAKGPITIFVAAAVFFVLLGISPSLEPPASTTLTSVGPTEGTSLEQSNVDGDLVGDASTTGSQFDEETQVIGGGGGDLDSTSSIETASPVKTTASSTLTGQGGLPGLTASGGSNSLAPNTVVMPDLTGLTSGPALLALVDAGIPGRLGGNYVCSDYVAKDKIVMTDPVPGAAISLRDRNFSPPIAWYSSGPCKAEASEYSSQSRAVSYTQNWVGNRLVGSSVNFFYIAEDNGLLDLGLSFSASSNEQVLVDFKSVCVIDIDFKKQFPCVHANGFSFGGAVVPAGQTAQFWFRVDLNQAGLGRPDSFGFYFALDSPQSGFTNQRINVTINSWSAN